jgi:glucose/arabinose dehydrogenase
VIRKNGFDGPVSVDYTTVADTATPGDDYIQQSGTLLFGDGEAVKSIIITLIPNDQVTQEFKITIDNNQGAELLAPRTATVVIVGSDADMVDMEQPPPPVDPDSVDAVDLITGIAAPTNLAWLPDGTMLIGTKGGIVYVASGNTLAQTPFIDISDIVNNRNDRGLLSIACHPDFINKPYVYLLYTYEGTDNLQELQELVGTFAGPDAQGARAGRLVRVTANQATGYRTHVPGSEVILLGKNSIREYFNPFVDLTVDFDEPQGGFVDGEYVQDFINSDSLSHTVGGLEFHPDGSLLISLGDGASYNRVDPRAWRVMDENSLAGKVLRIDAITGKGLPSNPYYSQTNDPDANSAKVWQMGIRNSFRITADQDSGLLYLGEVGWTTWEEVNRGGSGANFGWPYYEGSGVLGSYANTPLGQEWKATGAVVTPPILELNHQETGINAIVLGDKLSSTYYGAKFKDALFFNDLGQGTLRFIKFDGAGKIVEVDLFATGAERVVSIQEGPDGLLYYCNVSKNTVGRWERK